MAYPIVVMLIMTRKQLAVLQQTKAAENQDDIMKSVAKVGKTKLTSAMTNLNTTGKINTATSTHQATKSASRLTQISDIDNSLILQYAHNRAKDCRQALTGRL